MDDTKAGLDQTEAEEKYIKKQVKKKKKRGMSSLPCQLAHPLGHQTPFFSPNPVACSHCWPRAGQLRGAGRAQLIKNANERWGRTAAVAFRRCKLQEGFIGSVGVESTPRPAVYPWQGRQPLPAPLGRAWSFLPGTSRAEKGGRRKDGRKERSFERKERRFPHFCWVFFPLCFLPSIFWGKMIL